MMRRRSLDALDPGEVHLLDAASATKVLGDETEGVVLALRGSIGEGSCFFHSIFSAGNIFGYNALSPAHQQRVVHAFRCAMASTSAGNGIPRADWCNPRKWADEAMIMATARELQLNILFVDQLRDLRYYCGVHTTVDNPTVVVFWQDGKHFEAVLQVVDSKRSLFRGVHFKSGLAQHLWNSYTSVCRGYF
jgi:hypothetical protein